MRQKTIIIVNVLNRKTNVMLVCKCEKCTTWMEISIEPTVCRKLGPYHNSFHLVVPLETTLSGDFNMTHNKVGRQQSTYPKSNSNTFILNIFLIEFALLCFTRELNKKLIWMHINKQVFTNTQGGAQQTTELSFDSDFSAQCQGSGLVQECTEGMQLGQVLILTSTVVLLFFSITVSSLFLYSLFL